MLIADENAFFDRCLSSDMHVRPPRPFERETMFTTISCQFSLALGLSDDPSLRRSSLRKSGCCDDRLLPDWMQDVPARLRTPFLR
jgi:hypothetical protein